MDDIMKMVTKDKESALKFLKDAGIVDNDNQLAEPYREEEPLSEETEKMIDETTAKVAEGLMNQLENNILEEEIKKMQRRYKTIEEYDGQYATLYASDIEHIARHFATWQKDRDQFQIDMAHDGGYMEGQDYAREQMMKDEKWLQNNYKKIYNNGWDEGFGDGRDSMEEDMMKDVVEIPLHQWLPSLLYDKMSEKGFKDGDMVKLIIVKEE